MSAEFLYSIRGNNYYEHKNVFEIELNGSLVAKTVPWFIFRVQHDIFTGQLELVTGEDTFSYPSSEIMSFNAAQNSVKTMFQENYTKIEQAIGRLYVEGE